MLSTVVQKRLRARRFFLTFADCPIPIETAMRQLQRFNPSYLLTAQETAPSTGNLHLHSLLMFPSLFYTSDMQTFDIKDDNGKNYHPNIQIVQSLSWTINYVKKDGNWQEVGVCPIKQKRMEAKEKIEFMKTHTIEQIMDSGNYSIAEIRNCMFIKREIDGMKMLWPYFKPREIFWFFGETGVGKTRRAVAECRLYCSESWTILSGDLRTFMVGYNGERGVIIDDIRAGTMLFAQLLRITDGYRCIVNIKGGQREWLAERIYFTAPVRPEEMFKDKETGEQWDHIDQLLRRIRPEHIVEINEYAPEWPIETQGPHPDRSFEVPAPENLNQVDTEILLSPILKPTTKEDVPHLHDSNEVEGVKNFLEPQWTWEGAP